MPLKNLSNLVITAVALTALAACSSTTGGGAGSATTPSGQPFEIASVTVSPMTKANLCRDLGGQGQAPTLTIKHSAAAGVPIRIKLTDHWSDGGTFNHRSTRVTSDGSGTTIVNYAFLPPCNTTGGRINSDYRFTIDAGGASETVRWARFNSGSRTIN